MKLAINYILNKRYSAHVWCGLFLFSFLLFNVQMWHLASSIKQGFRFLVIDGHNYYLPHSYEFKDAHALHYEQAYLAAQTLLNRHQSGLDSPERLVALFHPEAYKKANQLVNRETPLFEKKSMHQKVHIKEVKIMKMENASVKLLITGQLLRMGYFADEVFVEELDFEMSCGFVFNTNFVENGRYPTVVYDYELKTKAVPLL